VCRPGDLLSHAYAYYFPALPNVRTQDMKFLDPRTADAEMTKYFGLLLDDINSSFDALLDM
jgi:hypothetical protein